MANVILKSVDKLTLGFHTFEIGNKGLSTNKDLGCSLPTINGGCVRKNRIRSNRFITSVDIGVLEAFAISGLGRVLYHARR